MKVIYLKRSYIYKAVLFIIVLAVALILAESFITPSIAVFSYNNELPIYSVECQGKKAAITFDCAWGAEDIPEILDALENENVRATFFIVGQWAEKNGDAVKLIAQKGHDIGNHSYSHLRMGMLDLDRTKKEIQKCTDKLTEITGVKVELFRPPYGDYSKNLTRTAAKMSYYTIQWDVDSLDWKEDISAETITERVLKYVRPGSIILFHNDTKHTAKVLPGIIASLKEKGYELVPVSELILRDNYTIDHTGRQISRK